MPPPGKNAARKPPKRAAKSPPSASNVPRPNKPKAPEKAPGKPTKSLKNSGARALPAKSKAKPSRPRATTKLDEFAPSKPPATEYQEAYSDDSFWAKVKGYGKAAGGTVMRPALMMYYSGVDSATPLWARSTIGSALGYFILPVDAIPDFTPVIGYADDLGVLTAAVAMVAAHITPAHKAKARKKLREWFD